MLFLLNIVNLCYKIASQECFTTDVVFVTTELTEQCFYVFDLGANVDTVKLSSNCCLCSCVLYL